MDCPGDRASISARHRTRSSRQLVVTEAINRLDASMSQVMSKVNNNMRAHSSVKPSIASLSVVMSGSLQQCLSHRELEHCLRGGACFCLVSA